MVPKLYIALAVIVVILLSYQQYRHRHHADTLYDRLGGVYAIAAVVDHFSDNVVNNPIAGRGSPNPALRDWYKNKIGRLPGLKFMRTLWVCAVAGGPFTYSPTKPGKCPFSLENAHADLKISPLEFDAVAHELANSLDHFKVPAREKAEVLAAFAAHKPEVNMGYAMTHGGPVKHPSCPMVF